MTSLTSVIIWERLKSISDEVVSKAPLLVGALKDEKKDITKKHSRSFPIKLNRRPQGPL